MASATLDHGAMASIKEPWPRPWNHGLDNGAMASIMEPWQDNKLRHKQLVWRCIMAALHMSYMHA